MTFGEHAEANDAWEVPRAAPIGPSVVGPDQPRRFMMLKRLALAGATAFIAVNIWTGCPLLALWVGSQAVGQGTLSMAAVCVVIVVLAALVFVMAVMLTWLNGVYDELIGRPAANRGRPGCAACARRARTAPVRGWGSQRSSGS